ncbi:beta-aspartyl-peptidase [Fusibacter sp. 3D3]|uniref:beta-aspartyl-peptidase n=1 Tax=Fusibacter sp. 3D3 TaxID=1048380 RepID=UPI000852CCBC|nr:beta-aspartyl-peptidase [Fusibacter sp. 3D3]GAU79667.1 isoaspartyl dipeptidase [Fusibacter sp. 3D3]
MILIQAVKIIGNFEFTEGDILLGGEQILAIGADINTNTLPDIQVVDGRSLIAVPGFIDAHVHVCGGGGEGGFSTRTPEIQLTDLTIAGVTTVVGCLGTDGVTRSLEGLLAKIRALESEGINAYMYTGNYRIPLSSMTGSVMRDLILIDKVIGVGEVALSDHRSSQPTYDEFQRLAADTRVGAMLAGKTGIINIHLGDGSRMLELVERILDETEIPIKHFFPTHMNRNPELVEKAMDYGKRGGLIDFTTCTNAQFIEEGEVPAGEAMARCLNAGVAVDRISFSSDAQGSLPVFDSKGNLMVITVGKPTSLYGAVRDAVALGVPFETAIQSITSTPAALLGLKNVGRLEVGCLGDVVLVDRESLEIVHVFAKGRQMTANGKPLVRGTFE